MRRHLFIAIIIAFYLILGSLFIALVPPWQAPDEPAHYNYVAQLAAGRLPVIAAGDYNQAYLNQVVFESHFAPGYRLDSLQYEDWQPPLYYLLQTPVYLLTGGSLTAMRYLSLLLGAGVVILAYAIVLRIAPEMTWLAQTTAAFVAFLPQHLAMLSAVNNDALAELLIAAVLWVLLGLSRRDAPVRTRELLLLGTLLGLGFLTKGTVYPLAAITLVVLLWRYWGAWRELWRAGMLVFMAALLLGALWWGRNITVYGGVDILGKAAHDRVVVGQPRTMEWVAQFGWPGTAWRFVDTTFNSFWGQFGWMTVPMTYPGWLYPLLWLFSGMAFAGLVLAAVRGRRAWRDYRLPVLVLLLLFLLTSGVHLAYNLTFVQHQGRYLFPALIPIALGVALGIAAWGRPLLRRHPQLTNAIPVILALALIGLDIYALFRVIVPAFS